MIRVSILHPNSRLRSGANFSHEVTGEVELTGDVVTSEAWSPTLYSKPRRHTSNFLEAQVLGFDVDGELSLADAVERFASYRHIIGTTENHQRIKNQGKSNEKPACDRYRVILFTSTPILTAEDYKYTLVTLAAELGIPLDEQAKDAARWFIPCVAIASINDSGKTVAVYTAPAPRYLAKQPTLQNASEAKGRLSKATRDFLAQEPSSEGWHGRFIKAAMDFKEQGYSEAEAALRLRTASPELELDDTDLAQLADVYTNRGGALPLRPAWPVMIPSRDAGGQPYPSPKAIENQRYLLTEVLGYKFEANKRREVLYYSERGGERQLLTDSFFPCLNTRAREHRIQPGEPLRELVIDMANANEFDPILDELAKLKWDGGSHIAQLFETITLPPETTDEQRKWYALFLRRWLIGVVTKVYSPGSENNVLVFQGAQAAGKSRWLKRLAELWPEGFGEGSISPDDKDHELRHLDNFIWHVAEFDSTTSRREVGALKDYFTKDVVNVRRPYARLPIIGRSICSFCASVNSHEFLHDATGNRRYLVIPVISVNANHTVSIPQVLAEAKAAMEGGERNWFTREEIEQVNALNQHFLSKEEYLELLEARAKPGEQELTLAQIMEKVGAGDVQLTRPIRSNIRTTLEQRGIRKRNVSGSTKFLVNEALLTGRAATGTPVKLIK